MESQVGNYCMNIHLIEFDLPHDLVKNDEVLIKISSYPEKQKVNIEVPADKIKYSNQIASINVKIPKDENIKERTEKIVFSFKSKDRMGRERNIAMSYIRSDEFPKVQGNNNEDNSENQIIFNKIQTFDIYQTTKEQKKEFYEAREKGFIGKFEISSNNTIKRKVIGEMKIQLSLYHIDPEINSSFNNGIISCNSNSYHQEFNKASKDNNKDEKAFQFKEEYRPEEHVNYSHEDNEFQMMKSKNTFKANHKNNNQYEQFF